MGFSIDEYQPLADTSEGMSRIVRFAQLATEEAGGTWTAKGNGIYEFRGRDGRCSSSFTDDRDQSLEQEHLQLLGLDHPLVLEYLERYRNVPPAELGVRVRSVNGQSGIVPHGRLQLREAAVRPELVSSPSRSELIAAECHLGNVLSTSFIITSRSSDPSRRPTKGCLISLKRNSKRDWSIEKS